MSKQLHTFYQNYSKQIQAILAQAAGQPPVFVADEAVYRKVIIDAGWNSLPANVQQAGRTTLRWDELFLALRTQVYQKINETVALRSNVASLIQSTLDRLFGSTPSAPATIPTAAPVSQSPSAPVAAPVAKSAATTKQTEGAVIGIDLGTTYSVIAFVDTHGRPQTILNGAGDLTTPSVILFDGDTPVVGKEAVMGAAMEPEQVAGCVKRDMGARAFRKKINGKQFPPEVLSSIILKSLKQDAERKLGPVGKAVITVPAYFDESRRRATIDAGKMAGLEVLGIINEPTAAALAYGFDLGFLDEKARTVENRPRKTLIYDLGGGTFDVTIVQIEGNNFRAIATDGDVTLGGKDWDEKLVGIIAEQLKTKLREDPRENPTTTEELWQAAETAKKTLTERNKATVYINHLGSRHKVEVTRQEFEEATSSLLGRTRTTMEIVLRQAHLKWDELDNILLVGGSTRMPMVVRMLTELSGKEPDRSVSPDEAVAHGAALYANLLAKKQGDIRSTSTFEIVDVNSHSLGLVGIDPSTGRKKNQILIPKNTPLPHAVTGTFKTGKANQANVMLRIVEGESERPEACSQIGTCKIEPLPPNLPAGWPIYVKYAYLADGQLQVTAQVKGQDKAVSTIFQRERNMDSSEMEHWTRYLLEIEYE